MGVVSWTVEDLASGKGAKGALHNHQSPSAFFLGRWRVRVRDVRLPLSDDVPEPPPFHCDQEPATRERGIPGRIWQENNVAEKKFLLRNFAKYFSVVLRIFAKFSQRFFYQFSKISLHFQHKILAFGTQKNFANFYSVILRKFTTYFSCEHFLHKIIIQ